MKATKTRLLVIASYLVQIIYFFEKKIYYEDIDGMLR